MRSTYYGLLLLMVTTAASAQTAKDDADALFTSRFPIDDEHPGARVPSAAERDEAPLDFAYYVMNLVEKATAAANAGDARAQIEYLRAVAAAVPDHSLGFSRLCAAYEMAQQYEAAEASCAAAVTLAGTTLPDFERYVRLVFGRDRELRQSELERLREVAEHLRREAPRSPALVDIECQLAVRTRDALTYPRCEAALRLRPQHDVKVLSYTWSWAMLQSDFATAQRIVQNARTSSLPPELVERMARARAVATPYWQQLLRFVSGRVAIARAQVKGSDTLEGITKSLLAIAACNGQGLTYSGGGSGTGETAMINETQSIAPMSRPLNNTSAVCVTAGGNQTAEGMLFGLDGMVVVADSEQTARCGSENHLHTPRVGAPVPSDAPTPVYSDLGSDWATKLRAIYWGLPPGTAPTGADCNSAERQALFNDYKNLFPNACSGTHGHKNTCSGIAHAFRRGDRSGTTDLFRQLLNAGTTPFCNGNDQEDRDPLRRPCRDCEQVCSADGKLGFVLPIVVPETDDVNLVSSTTRCQDGRFRYVPAPFEDSECCFRNPDGSCALPTIGLKCPQPVAGPDNLPCLNGLTSDEFDCNQLVGDRFDFDCRAYNLQVRRPGTGQLLTYANGTEVLAAFYRIHSTRGGLRTHHDPTPLCREVDATRQIGCLVQAPPAGCNCSIGFAGGEAVQLARAEPLALEQIDWTDRNIQNLVSGAGAAYPLARKLYVNAIHGFETLTGAERNLAACFATPTTINPVLDQFGFTRLPNQDPICEEACPNGPAGPHCSNNTAPFF
jgi:hypothetical protein